MKTPWRWRGERCKFASVRSISPRVLALDWAASSLPSGHDGLLPLKLSA